MNVVKLPVLNLREIVSGLRYLADKVETGAIKADAAIVVFRHDDDHNIFAFGPDMDGLRIIGLLQVAAMAAGRTGTCFRIAEKK